MTAGPGAEINFSAPQTRAGAAVILDRARKSLAGPGQ
jgi:hypothetical protein